MNQISPLLKPDSIQTGLSFNSKTQLFEHAARWFESRYGLKASEVFANLTERERLGSTALGSGVAIPHGRIKGLKQAAGAFFRISPALEFDAPDNRPVSLCFILLAPTDANEAHLQILGELAQLFGDPSMREQMNHAADAAALYRLLDTWKA
ncbi:MAG TPA: PTS sugar transporter subunit IIA [Thiobacillaceae bacterium]|nr:PTS sugar transporter subunit IIA [Thiobacillaceae bacterium]